MVDLKPVGPLGAAIEGGKRRLVDAARVPGTWRPSRQDAP